MAYPTATIVAQAAIPVYALRAYAAYHDTIVWKDILHAGSEKRIRAGGNGQEESRHAHAGHVVHVGMATRHVTEAI